MGETRTGARIRIGTMTGSVMFEVFRHRPSTISRRLMLRSVCTGDCCWIAESELVEMLKAKQFSLYVRLPNGSYERMSGVPLLSVKSKPRRVERMAS